MHPLHDRSEERRVQHRSNGQPSYDDAPALPDDQPTMYRPPVPWFERFFGDLYGEVLAHTFTAAQTRQHVRMVQRLLRLRRGDRVLDVPCGHGRIAVPLAKRGVRVTGIDLSPAYLTRARDAARAAGVSAKWLRRDMRAIDFEEQFDAALNWFGSFGYFSDRDNLAFARRVCNSLRPGGRFLLEGLNRPWIVRHHLATLDETYGGVRVVVRWAWNQRLSRMADSWTMSRGHHTERHRTSVRLYSGRKIRALLTAAGFERVDLFDRSPDLGKLTARSRRWVALAHKAAPR